MPNTFKRFSAVLAFILVSASAQAVAAQPNLGTSIQGRASVSNAYSGQHEEPLGAGYTLQADFIIAPYEWFNVRAYLGMIKVGRRANDEYCEQQGIHCHVTAHGAIGGLMARLTVPIPWISPFIGAGLGSTFGRYSHRTPNDYTRRNGMFMHVPLTLGLALGPHSEVDLGATVLRHPGSRGDIVSVYLALTLPLTDGPRLPSQTANPDGNAP